VSAAPWRRFSSVRGPTAERGPHAEQHRLDAVDREVAASGVVAVELADDQAQGLVGRDLAGKPERVERAVVDRLVPVLVGQHDGLVGQRRLDLARELAGVGLPERDRHAVAEQRPISSSSARAAAARSLPRASSLKAAR
jgi:hypothetical protein